MRKFIAYLKELFEFKNYKWIKKGVINVAKFECIDTYYIHFDSIGCNAYNVYFYYQDLEGNKVFDLINAIDNRSYKVLSNVKNCIEDFMKNNQVDFLGYSSYNKERNELYMLMLQNLQRIDDIYTFKEVGKKCYYFLYKKEISLESHLYVKRFLENDDKNKK